MGIQLGSNFTVNTALPLDDRIQVADTTARDAIPAGRRYEGLIVYVIADGTNYQLVGGITDGDWTELSGAGGGSGGINFIENGDGESDTAGWSVYANITPSSKPEADPFGTPSGGVTWVQSSSGPLIGDGSFILSKDASNRQGEGVFYDFTVPIGYLGSVVSIKLRYLVLVGSTFNAGTSTTDSDITIWIGDRTTDTIIQPSSYKLLSNSNSVVDEFQAEFQVPVDDINYRLYFHVGSTNASAYSLKFDQIEVSPSQYVFGNPIIDSVTVPLTWSSVSAPVPTKGTIVRDYYRYSKLGDKIVLELDYEHSTAGGGGTGITLVPLPPGVVMDSTQPLSTTPDVIVGTGKFSNAADGASTSSLPLVVVPYNSTHLAMYVQSISGANLQNSYSAISSGSNSLANTNFNVSFKAEFKVAGWSSSVQMADQTSTRVVSFRGTASGQTPQTLNSTTAFSLTANEDTHAAWSANTYTAPVSGYYFINWLADAGIVTTGSINHLMQAYIIKNGVATITGLTRSQVSASLNNFQITANGTLLLNAGDTIRVNLNTNFTTPGTTASGTLSILRISGPSQIAASETIAASYWLSSNFTANSTTPINFDSKEFDTHNAVTTSATAWRFTAPISGLYEVDALFIMAAAGSDYIKIRKNGTSYKNLAVASNTGSAATGSAKIRLNAGDYIDLVPSSSLQFNGGALNGSSCNIQITKIGF